MSEKKKLLITIAVVVVVMLGEMVVLYLAMDTVGDAPFGSPTGLTQQIDAQKVAIAKEVKRIKTIPERRKERDALRGEQKLARQLLPNLNKPEKYVQFFQQIGIKSGVLVVGITPKPPLKKAGGIPGFGGSDKFDEWSFDMEIEGGFNQIAKFVNGMEQFEEPSEGKRFFAVKDITITAQDNGVKVSGVVRHKAKLILKTYRYTGQDTR